MPHQPINEDQILCVLQRKIANSDAVDLTAPRNNIGEWFFKKGKDWEYFCITLEDEIRPDGIKVAQETAIPEGIYELFVTYSPKFKRFMVLLMPTFEYHKNKSFEGIRAHGGTSEKNTWGCIIVAKKYNPITKTVSENMEEELRKRINKMLALNSHVYLKIENKQLASNDELSQKLI